MIRFVASEWRKLQGVSMPPIFFLIAKQHLEKTMSAPVVRARKELSCWACECVIEIGEDYQTTAADRKLKLGAHVKCLRQVKRWADRQWKANKKRWVRNSALSGEAGEKGK